MTKNPYDLQKSLQIFNTIIKHKFGIGSRCNMPMQDLNPQPGGFQHNALTAALSVHPHKGEW